MSISQADLKEFIVSQMGETNRNIADRVSQLRWSAKEKGVEPEKIAELEKKLMKILDKRISKFLDAELGKIEYMTVEPNGTFKIHIIPSEKNIERKKEQKKKYSEISEELHKKNEERVQEYIETLGK